MTVAELIAVLQKMDPNLPVAFQDGDVRSRLDEVLVLNRLNARRRDALERASAGESDGVCKRPAARSMRRYDRRRFGPPVAMPHGDCGAGLKRQTTPQCSLTHGSV